MTSHQGNAKDCFITVPAFWDIVGDQVTKARGADKSPPKESQRQLIRIYFFCD